MKSLAELAAIKAKMKDKVALRDDSDNTRVVVGMATCGIAAGARPVLVIQILITMVQIFKLKKHD